MTERTFSARHSEDLDRADSPHALIWFLTIEHPSFNEPLRIVSDYFEYLIDGNVYIAAPFEVTPLTDSDTAASAEIRVQNVDRRISEAMEADTSGTRALVSAVARSSQDFDLSQDPRVPLDPNDIPAIYSYEMFEIADVRGDAISVTGRVTMVDVAQEPWPVTRATQNGFPGLFV